MPSQNSYERFLEQVLHSPVIKMREESRTAIQLFSNSTIIPAAGNPVAFLLDFTTRKYLHVDESCSTLLGYSADFFLQKGLEEYLGKFHPSDYRIIASAVFDNNMNFLRSIQSDEYSNYIISYNYRLLNPHGEYVKLIQRFSFIPSTLAGKPFGTVGIIFDVTHFKNDNSIIHTIERRSSSSEYPNELVFKKGYPVTDEYPKFPLSNREVELVKYMSAGLSSKQIAERLHLSINTVNNHRKNMLQKTSCKSSAELIRFAFKHGLL